MYVQNSRKSFGCTRKAPKHLRPGPVTSDLAVFPLLSSAQFVLIFKWNF